MPKPAIAVLAPFAAALTLRTHLARAALFLAALALTFAVLSHLARRDSDQAALEQQRYCEHVKQGAWPDFKQTYDSTCP